MIPEYKKKEIGKVREREELDYVLDDSKFADREGYYIYLLSLKYGIETRKERPFQVNGLYYKDYD